MQNLNNSSVRPSSTQKTSELEASIHQKNSLNIGGTVNGASVRSLTSELNSKLDLKGAENPTSHTVSASLHNRSAQTSKADQVKLEADFFKDVRNNSLDDTKLKVFLDKGLNINCISDTGFNALFSCVKRKQYELGKLLVQFGINLNAVHGKGPISIIEYIIRQKDLAFLKIVVEAGADIQKPYGRFKQTPLMLAVRENNIDMVTYLIQKGANVVDARNIDGLTVFDQAITAASIEILDSLLQHIKDINGKHSASETLLMTAISKHNVNVIKLLISKGADVYKEDDRGLNAFEYVMVEDNGFQNNGTGKLLKCLLKHKDINTVSTKYGTLLMAAVTHESLNSIKYLLFTKINIHSRNKQGLSALDIAKNMKYGKAIDLIMEAEMEASVL